MGMVTEENVHDVVSYHAPAEDAIAKIAAIRESTEAHIRVILANAPPCADRSDAIRSVRNAMMAANASIVLGGQI